MSKNICSKDLKLIYNDGKIDIDIEDVQERLKELEKIMDTQTYLSRHNYKIWQGNKGFYYTYLPDIVKGRILLKKKTESDLIKAIVNFYKCHNTVCMLFEEWLEYKKLYRLI